MHETFFTLLQDPAHWLFELFLMAVFDGLVGALLWPWIKGRLNHHDDDHTKFEELHRAVALLARSGWCCDECMTTKVWDGYDDEQIVHIASSHARNIHYAVICNTPGCGGAMARIPIKSKVAHVVSMRD